MWGWWKRRRRQRILAAPFPPAWQDILTDNMPHYGQLTPAQRGRLHDDLRILVAEKNWEGCRGLVITDEIKVTIAGHASLMMLGGNRHDYFNRVLSILVYPSGFRHPRSDQVGVDNSIGLIGQSVYRGPVILAWDAVLYEGRDRFRGSNVVIHEFAHQLDDLDGSANGTPDLDNPGEAATWQWVMTTEYNRLLQDIRRGRETFLGDYAATNTTEFFAVASERFFMLPLHLQRYHPHLYDVLARFYGIDPADWFDDFPIGRPGVPGYWID